MDERTRRQTPPELLIILAAIADEGIPLQTIAPKFTGRFKQKRGLRWQHCSNSKRSFNDDLASLRSREAVWTARHTQAERAFGQRQVLHLWADAPGAAAVRRGIAYQNGGNDLAGGSHRLAEAGGNGLALAKEIYGGALEHVEDLCAPYATVIDIDRNRFAFHGDGFEAGARKQFVSALRHDQKQPRFQPALAAVAACGLQDCRRDGPAVSRRVEGARSRGVEKRHPESLRTAYPNRCLRAMRRQNRAKQSRQASLSADHYAIYSRGFSPATTRDSARLYHHYAEDEPILDFHCHLCRRTSPGTASSGTFSEIWLEGDHYKWRAMRSKEWPESFWHGSGRSVRINSRPGPANRSAYHPHPLYHWTPPRVKRYFCDVEELLDEASAVRIWNKANERLAAPELTGRAS